MTATRPSDLIAQRIKEVRTARGWTAKDLAAQCAKTGAPEITTSVIANIETGRRGQDGRRRREVTVEELLKISYALEIPPVMLFLPLNERLEITPAVEMDGYTTASWITGDDRVVRHPADAGRRPDLTDEGRARRARRWRREARPLDVLRNLFVAVQIFKQAEAGRIKGLPPEQADLVLGDSAQPIANLVSWLWSNGITPPPLPRRVIDILRDPDALEYPIEIPPDDLVAEDGQVT